MRYAVKCTLIFRRHGVNTRKPNRPPTWWARHQSTRVTRVQGVNSPTQVNFCLFKTQIISNSPSQFPLCFIFYNCTYVPKCIFYCAQDWHTTMNLGFIYSVHILSLWPWKWREGALALRSLRTGSIKCCHHPRLTNPDVNMSSKVASQIGVHVCP